MGFRTVTLVPNGPFSSTGLALTMKFVPVATHGCPPHIDGIAEAYCLASLDEPTRLVFEDHFLTCARCAAVVANADEYIRSMRTPLRQIQAETTGRQTTAGTRI